MNTTATPTSRDLNKWEIDRADFLRALIPSSPDAHRRNPELAKQWEDEIAADVDETIATWRTLPAPGPCPPYCDQPTGHGYTEDDPRSPKDSSRSHGQSFGDRDGHCGFHVSQLEVAHPDGTVTLHAPVLLLPDNNHDAITDVHEMADIADSAAAAVRLVRKINQAAGQ